MGRSCGRHHLAQAQEERRDVTALPRHYIRLPDGTIEFCEDEARFIKWYNDVKNRRVFRAAVPYGDFKKAVIVETRFTGMESLDGDGEPRLFETFARLPDGTELVEFDATQVDAEVSHQDMVEQVEQELATNPAYREFSKGLEEILENPGAVPLPRPRKVASPKLRAPRPDCPKCHGTGAVRGAFEMVPCDCTIITT